MKKIIMAVCSIMVLSVGIASADPQPAQTPITERTYADLNHGCFSSCNAQTGHPDDPRWRYYCSCACDQGEQNCRTVVSKYRLVYEEQMEAHLAEIMPNSQDVLMCKGKAGI